MFWGVDICNKNLAYSQMQVFLFLFKDSSPKGAHTKKTV